MKYFVLSLQLAAVGWLGGISTGQAQVWTAWSVHGGEIDLSQTGEVTVNMATSGSHYWNKSNSGGGPRSGQKAYVSTNYFNGSTVGQVTSLDWATSNGSPGDAYLNIYVENSLGGNAILAFTNNQTWGVNDVDGNFTIDGTDRVYHLFETTGDWTGFTTGFGAGSWDDVKDLTIVGDWLPPDGPDDVVGSVFQDVNDNNLPSAQANALFGDDHWLEWGGSAAYGGFLWVFGQSTQPAALTQANGITLENVSLEYDPDGAGVAPSTPLAGLNVGGNTTVVPEPTSSLLLLSGLGLLALRRRQV